jgi:hypothetical protein
MLNIFTRINMVSPCCLYFRHLGASFFGGDCFVDIWVFYDGETEWYDPIQYTQYVVTSSAHTAASTFRAEREDSGKNLVRNGGPADKTTRYHITSQKTITKSPFTDCFINEQYFSFFEFSVLLD